VVGLAASVVAGGLEAVVAGASSFLTSSSFFGLAAGFAF
jgi:hypothetical protein